MIEKNILTKVATNEEQKRIPYDHFILLIFIARISGCYKV